MLCFFCAAWLEDGAVISDMSTLSYCETDDFDETWRVSNVLNAGRVWGRWIKRWGQACSHTPKKTSVRSVSVSSEARSAFISVQPLKVHLSEFWTRHLLKLSWTGTLCICWTIVNVLELSKLLLRWVLFFFYIIFWAFFYVTEFILLCTLIYVHNVLIQVSKCHETTFHTHLRLVSSVSRYTCTALVFVFTSIKRLLNACLSWWTTADPNLTYWFHPSLCQITNLSYVDSFTFSTIPCLNN